MATTANLYVRIDPDVKEQAEYILNSLGLPVSDGRKVAQNQRSKSSPTEKNWMGDFDGKLGADQDITQRGFINP